MIELEVKGKNKRIKLGKEKTIKNLLEKQGIRVDDFVITVNGKVVLEDEKLKDKDKIKLYPVISGG